MPLSSPGLRLCGAVPPRWPGCRHAQRIGGTTRRDREAFVPRRTASARSGGYESLSSLPYYSVGTASGTSARAALAQSTSFCTVGDGGSAPDAGEATGDQDNLSAHPRILLSGRRKPNGVWLERFIVPATPPLPNCARHDGEARALVFGRADLDAVSEQIRRVLHNEEPKPKTIQPAFVGPFESPEDRRKRAGADADAGV